MLENTLEILLVEDNASDVDLLEIALKDSIFKLHLNVCSDGEQAMQFLNRERQFKSAPRPDLVILDLNLPKKTGHEVLKEIKADPELCEIPVAVLTTAAQESDRPKILSYPSAQLFNKPFRFRDYKKVLQSIWDFWESAKAVVVLS
jgi:chemotaxis family two-component system response regulator Rcp1